jgi:hypothetical protein
MNILYKHFSSLYNRIRLIANRYRGIYKIQQNDPTTTKIPKYFSGLEKTSYATRTDNFETEPLSQTMPPNWFVYLTENVTQPCTSFPSTYGTWQNINNKISITTDVESVTNPVLYANTDGNVMQVSGNFYEGEFSFYAKFSKNRTPTQFTYVAKKSKITVKTLIKLSCFVDGNEVFVTETESNGYVKYSFKIATGPHTIVWSLYTNYDLSGNPMVYPKLWINSISYTFITGTTRTPSVPSTWWISGQPTSAIYPPYKVQTFEESFSVPYAGGENDNSGRTPVIQHQPNSQYGSIGMPQKVWDGKEGWEENQSTKFAIKDEDVRRMIDHTIVLSQVVEPLDTRNKLPPLEEIKRNLDLSIEKGSVISKGSIESIEKVVDKILKVLDSYDDLYNADDICQIHCQISCQTGCLVGCQSCNNGQCHDQKCGIH